MRPSKPALSTAVGGVLAVVALAVGIRPLIDNSFFTHLATGRLILQSGVPTADPYSFTARGEPWTVQSWLYSAVIGLVDRASGGNGVRLLTGVLGAVLTALVWRLSRPARSLVARVVLLGPVIILGATFWSARPLLWGLVLLAVTLVVVEEERDARFLIPVFWLWANTHGSFPLGLVALAVMAFGHRLDGDRSTRRWKALGWAAVGTVAAVVGPVGLRLLAFPIALLGRNEILSRVLEWQSPNFGDAWARVFLVQAVLVVVALVRRPRWAIAVPFVVFLAAALLGLRNVPVASIVFVAAMAPGWQGIGGAYGAERRWPALALLGAETAAAFFIVASALSAPAYDLEGYPVDAFAWLADHGIDRHETRVVTQDTTGNFLELIDGASSNVFIDDRYDMYPIPFLREYLDLHGAAPNWREVLQHHRVDWLVWGRGEPLVATLAESPDWRIAYDDAKFVVACRRGSTNC